MAGVLLGTFPLIRTGGRLAAAPPPLRSPAALAPHSGNLSARSTAAQVVSQFAYILFYVRSRKSSAAAAAAGRSHHHRRTSSAASAGAAAAVAAAPGS